MKKAGKGLTVILTLLISIVTQAQSQKTLSPNEFEKKIASTTDKIILDVRTPDEFNQGHLVNAVNIDYRSNNFKKNISQLDKSKPVFVYCLSGGRSGSAADAMKELGFKEIYNLQGGVKAWSGANKELVK